MLPIKNVILYKHGVGYFERQAQVDGDVAIDLSFKAAEMNDVLKSLTVLDLNGGLISSISYESTKPIEKQLEDVAISLADENALTKLIAQLKGARVEVEVGSEKVEGTVVGIETVKREKDRVKTKSTWINLLVGGASLESFDLLEVKRLKLLDESVRGDLQHLLEILISSKKKDLKRLTIFANGEGKRSLVASYTVEAPVWKTSYRVILDASDPAASGTSSDEEPLLQGWAIVDNTQDEDWENVSLTLVSGLPVSFVHDLYSPRYKRRPVVEVKEEEAYAPPELEEAEGSDLTLDFALMDDYAPAAAAAGGAAQFPQPPPAPAPTSATREESVKVQTRTTEVGDLFQYSIDNPVTVKRNQSALVPILQTRFEGKRVAVYNGEVRDKNPMSAILFKNTTGLMLEGGPLTVLEGETYVGESMLDTLKQDEERLVPYSVELGCTVSIDHRSERDDVRLARIANGTLQLTRYRVERKIYVINNKTDRKLDLFLEHRYRKTWELVETEHLHEKTENFYRFRFDVEPKKTVRFVVSERGDEAETYSVSDVDADTVALWVRRKYIDDATRREIDAILALTAEAAALGRSLSEEKERTKQIVDDQKRLRENLQALGDSREETGLRERYVRELTAQEDELGRRRESLESLVAKGRELKERLRQAITELEFSNTVG